jgi:hypothetical protein
LQSEGFSVSGTWTSVTGGTGILPVVTQATGIVDPAGGNTADLIQLSVGSGTTSSDFCILRQSITFTAVAYSFSVYLRSATSGNQFVAIRFNSAPQTILTITPSWQRFIFSGTPSAGSRDFGFDLRGNNTSASGTAQFYAWGAQVELGSVATSYIPTTTEAVTRSADIIRKTGITSLIGQSEGTVYFEVEVTDEARNKWFCSIDSAANSFIQGWINTGRQINVQIQNGGSTVMSTLASSALSVGYHKVAFAYNTATNGCEMFIDGVQNPVASRTVVAPGLPAFNNFSFGGYQTSTSATLNAHVRAGALYPNRLPNTGVNSLQSLTAP